MRGWLVADGQACCLGALQRMGGIGGQGLAGAGLQADMHGLAGGLQMDGGFQAVAAVVAGAAHHPYMTGMWRDRQCQACRGCAGAGHQAVVGQRTGQRLLALAHLVAG